MSTLRESFLAWTAAGGREIGEVTLTHGSAEGDWILTHTLDAAEAGSGRLRRHTTPGDAREIAKLDAAGEFRPLKTAPTLVRGWELLLSGEGDVREALDGIYPAALANWTRLSDGEIPPGTLRDMLGRQTGMYRVTGLLRDEEAQKLVAETCQDSKCLRRILWPLDSAAGWSALPPDKTSCPREAATALPAIPILCTDACPLLVAAAREAVKARMAAEAENGAGASGA